MTSSTASSAVATSSPAKFAEYAKLPGGVAAIRNLLAASKILMALDPETLDEVTKSILSAAEDHRRETKPPSLWQIAKRATSEDSRRGISFMTLILAALGKSLKGHATGGASAATQALTPTTNRLRQSHI